MLAMKNPIQKLKSDAERRAKALDFLINPPENILIKKKGFDAVKAIRKDREEWKPKFV